MDFQSNLKIYERAELREGVKREEIPFKVFGSKEVDQIDMTVL